jgi:hypothetical protein
MQTADDGLEATTDQAIQNIEGALGGLGGLGGNGLSSDTDGSKSNA